jgi:chromosome segregation ATPase
MNGLSVIVVAAMLMCACSSQKDPAQQAVAAADDRLSSIHDEAAKYAPDALQAVEAQVAALKQSLAKGNYEEVLAAVPTVKAAIASLKQQADEKQSAADAALAQVKQQWRTLSAEVPKMVSDIKAQVDSVSSSKRLPKGLNKASFESVKTDSASLDSMWTDANNTVTSGDYAGAVSKGQAVKDKAAALMQSLGMKPG